VVTRSLSAAVVGGLGSRRSSGTVPADAAILRTMQRKGKCG
jgi:hypothetical protein